MPLDRVKIDRSIVDDVDRSDSARTIVSAVIHLIHGLGCEVICEGVERQEQIDVLRAIGCDTFQGFAFAAAMPEEGIRPVGPRAYAAGRGYGAEDGLKTDPPGPNLFRHSRESGNPAKICAAEIRSGIPAFAGMTIPRLIGQTRTASFHSLRSS